MELGLIFSISAACSIILLIIIKIYLKIREWFPVSVNCWFCNVNTKVPFDQYNSWVCLNCHQYNGFTEDGGYNRIISAQYDEYLNVPTSSIEPTKFERQGPTLCNHCSINQQLKIDQLASFVPFDVNNYDKEIEVYSNQLEKVYDICGNCKRMLSELFEKEKQLYQDPKKLSSSSNSVSYMKLIRRRPKLLYYMNIISCTPLFADVLLTSVPKTYWELLLEVKNEYIILPNWIDLFCEHVFDVSTLCEHIFDISKEYYTIYHYNVQIGLIGCCVLIYLLEFIKKRTVSNLLNISAWAILLSLKYFSTEFDDYILPLQGFTAALFLFLNCRSNLKVKIRRKVPEKIINTMKLTDSTNRNLTTGNRILSRSSSKASTTATISAFAAVTQRRDNIKSASSSPKLLPEFTSARQNRSSSAWETRSSSNQNLLKPIDDFRLSSLHIGSRKQSSVKNHLLTEPKPYLNSSNNLWSGNSVLSPPRLNIDELASPTTTPFLDQSPTLTRCSSPTSGIGSLSSTPQPPERLFEREYYNFPESSMSNHNRSHLMQSNYYTPYDPITPYTYYQFATMIHRMCTPPSSPSLVDSECNTSYKNVTNKICQCSHNSFFIVLISIVAFCNFILTVFMYFTKLR